MFPSGVFAPEVFPRSLFPRLDPYEGVGAATAAAATASAAGIYLGDSNFLGTAAAVCEAAICRIGGGSAPVVFSGEFKIRQKERLYYPDGIQPPAAKWPVTGLAIKRGGTLRYVDDPAAPLKTRDVSPGEIYRNQSLLWVELGGGPVFDFIVLTS